MNELSIDFETRSLVDIKLGAWRYAEDASTSILCAAFALPDEEPELWWANDPLPPAVYRWLMNGSPIRAFNAEFELAIYTRKLRELFPELPRMKMNQINCTQAEACAMNLPQGLAECAKALGLPADKQKSAEGKRLIQYLCRPYKGAFREDPVRLADLGDYCLQDVVTEVAVARKLRRLDKSELRLFRRNLQMNAKGLPVDLARVTHMHRRFHEIRDAAIAAGKAITGGISPTQTVAFTEFVGLENIQKKTVERAIAAGHEHSELLKLRQAAGSASLAKLNKLPLAICKDDTMKGLFKFHGAGTGRWVSQGGFNAQNLPRGDFETQAEYEDALSRIAEINHRELVSLLRAVFAFPMTVVDYSQIETRMLLWLAGDTKALDEFRRGLDPYKTMASRIFGCDYESVSKPQRQIGKTVVLACGFGQGWRGFINYAEGVELFLTDEESQTYVNAYRDKHAVVKSAWQKCQDAGVRAVQSPGTQYRACKTTFVVKAGYLWMIMPSGRRICYKSPWLTPGTEDWMGPQINYWGRDRYTRQWSKQTTYGGSMFQSITQGSARDVMADAMLRMWDAGMDVRGTVHDEVICKGYVQMQMEDIMLQLPAWCDDMPIGVDGWEGEYYRK